MKNKIKKKLYSERELSCCERWKKSMQSSDLPYIFYHEQLSARWVNIFSFFYFLFIHETFDFVSLRSSHRLALAAHRANIALFLCRMSTIKASVIENNNFLGDKKYFC